MVRQNKWIKYIIGISLLLGGCMKHSSTSKEVTDQYERVQDYKGEGYRLTNGAANDKVAEENREEVEKAAKAFFMKNYETGVKIHNLVGNKDGVTVFVESTEPVHFYTYAIVPFHQGTDRISVGVVRTQEGDVERSIREGLYRLIFEDEFKKLDSYLESVVSKEKVVGRTVESLQNVGGSGYMTPYYFMSSLNSDEAIQPVYELYMKDHQTSIETLKQTYDGNLFEADNLMINIMLFMEEEGVQPSEEIMERIARDIKERNDFPKGTYRVAINDNGVHKESFEGFKDNSIEKEVMREE
ncbi:uncharacterized protein DUF1672 [Bacillus sp. V-88]|uniref:DUF1672 family protein n=1 Tax=Rossellomorea vietnamensis TaxID=218284 RepID=UPI000551C7C9|nr:DUF1672 family protein [Rossellomorea vietnamensis]OXS53913.1 hypothetical protein B1B00_21350 [Bacillus sp. DSM 27956]PRX64059.1 uncharacterized protein DUF1672 [Bacillus sp. V-88]SLK25070.1 Protein of unknown function [Bacillus sp. V-88]